MVGCGLLKASFCPSIQIMLTFYDPSLVKSVCGDHNCKDQEGKVVNCFQRALALVPKILNSYLKKKIKNFTVCCYPFQSTHGCERLIHASAWIRHRDTWMLLLKWCCSVTFTLAVATDIKSLWLDQSPLTYEPSGDRTHYTAIEMG